MAKSKKELLAIRNESYRVVHAEVCRTCRYWQRLLATEGGLCIIVNAGEALLPRRASPFGTCDLWEGRQNDQ
jgi:hypothetical protein